MSILIATLNYNLPTLTDNLAAQIKQSRFTEYELMVVDNGSQAKNVAKSTTHVLAENVFFGGGVNVILDYFLKSNHEYVMILNNDLIFHGYHYISQMLDTAKQFDIAVLSPSVVNAEIDQCHWKQMHCWGTNDIRIVEWVDFQAPMLRRDICSLISPLPSELYLGWGVDFYTGLLSRQNALKTAVHDGLTVTHLNSQTFRQTTLTITCDQFCRAAEHNMNELFLNDKNYAIEYISMRKYGEEYNYIK